MTTAHQHRRKRYLATIHRLLGGDNTLSVCCAIRALERMNACDVVSRRWLIDLLAAPDPDVRMDAAAAIGRFGFSEAVEPLAALVTGDPEGDVRIQAAIALSRIGTGETVELLVDCVQQDGYPELDLLTDDTAYGAAWEVQGQALEGLGRIGDRRATAPIIELLRDDGYEELQESGYRVLARLDAGTAKNFLLDQLADGSATARRRAARALGSLPETGGGAGQASEAVLNGLLAAFSDPDPRVRAAAAGALGRVCEPRTVAPLTGLLSDPEPDVRSEAAAALGRMQGAAVVERLYEVLADPDTDTRRRVVRILGEIGDPSSFEPLFALIETTDEGLLIDLIGAIGRIGHGGADERIAAILADRRAAPHVRTRAALALGALVRASDNDTADNAGRDQEGKAGPSPLAALRAAVFDADKSVALAAMSALVRIDPTAAQPMLIALIGDGADWPEDRPELDGDDAPDVDPFAGIEDLRLETLSLPGGGDPGSSTLASILVSRVRNAAAAVKGTGESQDPHADESHEGVPAPMFRIQATRLLGEVGEPGSEAVATLIDLVESGPPELRCEALDALAAIGDPQALATIRGALGSELTDIRLAALDALGRLGGVADDEFDQLLEDPDPVIRERAVLALGDAPTAAVASRIARALEDEKLPVCKAALQAVSGQLDVDQWGDGIVAVMHRFGGELRIEAGAALRRVGAVAAADALLDELEDEGREEFHWICIDALAEMYAADGAGEDRQDVSTLADRQQDHIRHGLGPPVFDAVPCGAAKAE